MWEPAPAKVNLALHVRGRQQDGYHSLETLFAFTRFGDSLRATPADDWQLSLTGPFAAGLSTVDNLVLRAARAFAAQTGSRARHHFTLEKNIPVAAGLGGGSADAAATLRLLNRLAGAPLAAPALQALALKLGADVPACLASRTMYGSGRGEVLRPGPALGGTPILLANPRRPVVTSAVFRGWDYGPDDSDRGPLPDDWQEGRNDLTAAAVALVPEISALLAFLEAAPGVQLARMSGSGASCFALLAGPPPVLPPTWWGVATTLL